MDLFAEWLMFPITLMFIYALAYLVICLLSLCLKGREQIDGWIYEDKKGEKMEEKGRVREERQG